MDKVIWIFGAGASDACGLKWGYPPSYGELLKNPEDKVLRRVCISEIIRTLIDAQKDVSSTPHKYLLKKCIMASGRWKHQLVTTNWDMLLEKEIASYAFQILPPWLSSSHVYHLNGTVEEQTPIKDLELMRRSDFLLPLDAPECRQKAVESNQIFNSLLWTKKIVLIGMSFECSLDKGFLKALSCHQGQTPLGEAAWILVNPCSVALNEIGKVVSTIFPRSKCVSVESGYDEWVKGAMNEVFN